MEDGEDVDPPESNLPASLQVPETKVVPNSDEESDSGVEVLTLGNVLSNTANISNICKESPVKFNPIGMCECRQKCRKSGLHMVQKSLGFNNVGELCDGLPSQSKMVNEDGYCFFRSISYLLAGTKELHTYIKLAFTQFINPNGAHIQNAKAYLKHGTLNKRVLVNCGHTSALEGTSPK